LVVLPIVAGFLFALYLTVTEQKAHAEPAPVMLKESLCDAYIRTV
jgi:hypothetical protein